MKKGLVLFCTFLMLFASLPLFATGAKEEAEDGTIDFEVVVASGGSIHRYLNPNIDRYMEMHPEVNITLTLMETEQHRATMPVIMRSDDAPATGWLNYGSGDVPPLVEIGAVENLDKYYQEYGMWDFLPEHLNTHRIDGSMYHFSLAFVTTPLIFYNKAIFEEVGISIPETMEDLYDISEKLRDAGYQPLLMGDRNGWPGFHMYQCISTRTVPLEDYEKVLYFADNEAYMADYPGFEEAFQVMRDMKTRGVWGDGVLAMDDLEAQSVFLNGQGAMYETGTWAIGTLREGLGDDLDFFLFPAIKEEIGKVLTVSYPDEMIVSAYASDLEKDTVADFYNEVLSPNGQEFVAESGNIPIRTDLKGKDLAKNPAVDPITIGIVEEFSSGKYPITDEIVTFWGAELYAELRSVGQEVIGGSITAAEAVEKLDTLAERIRSE